jgi:hypothetical protein
MRGVAGADHGGFDVWIGGNDELNLFGSIRPSQRTPVILKRLLVIVRWTPQLTSLLYHAA